MTSGSGDSTRFHRWRIRLCLVFLTRVKRVILNEFSNQNCLHPLSNLLEIWQPFGNDWKTSVTSILNESPRDFTKEKWKFTGVVWRDVKMRNDRSTRMKTEKSNGQNTKCNSSEMIATGITNGNETRRRSNRSLSKKFNVHRRNLSFSFLPTSVWTFRKVVIEKRLLSRILSTTRPMISVKISWAKYGNAEMRPFWTKNEKKMWKIEKKTSDEKPDANRILKSLKNTSVKMLEVCNRYNCYKCA